jgi:uncharacterized alpha-E superfamily protein
VNWGASFLVLYPPAKGTVRALLCRVRPAASVFQIGRYIEREGYIAPMANAHNDLLLDHSDPCYSTDVWARLLALGGDLEHYTKRHGAFAQCQMLQNLALAARKPNSTSADAIQEAQQQ